MSKITKLLLILLIPSLTQACLWLNGTTIDGEGITYEDKTISSLFLKSSQKTTPREKFDEQFGRENNQTIEYIAFRDIMYGEYEKGIKRLLEIEKKTPNLYATASNLGTAYELQGDIPLSIRWIKEGIKRNVASHGGTEWLHVLILETKLRLESNATLLENSHMINLPATFEETTLIPIKGENYTIKSIRDALYYQLKERMVFVKPKDKTVADLLYTFAKIEEQTTVVEEASTLVSMAEKYGFSNQEEIDSIYHNANETISDLRKKVAFIGFLIIFVLVVLITIYVKQRKKRTKETIKKLISPLSFALSINIYIIIFTFLSMPLYGFIHMYISHIIMLYILLISVYPLAIYVTIKDIEKRFTIPSQPKQHILYSTILYIIFSTVIYFFFLKNFYIDLLYYFEVIAVLTLIVFYFLKWRMREYE